MPTLPIGTFDPTQAPSPDPYAGISPSTAALTPRHIPSGLPGEPATTGTATLGTRTTSFPVQQDTHAEQAAWIARFNEFDRIKRAAEEDRAWNEMMQQNQRAQGVVRNVESARRFQAVRQYQNDYERLVSEGTDSGTAAYQSMLRNPAAFGTGFGSAIRALAPQQESFTPTTMELPGVGRVVRSGRYGERVTPASELEPFQPTEETLPGGTRVVRTGRGSARVLTDPGMKAKQRVDALLGNYRALSDSIGLPGVDKKQTVAEMSDILDELRELRKAPAGAPAAAPATAPSAPAAVQPSALTPDLARDFLRRARGNKDEARRLARDAGYTF